MSMEDKCFKTRSCSVYHQIGRQSIFLIIHHLMNIQLTWESSSTDHSLALLRWKSVVTVNVFYYNPELLFENILILMSQKSVVKCALIIKVANVALNSLITRWCQMYKSRKEYFWVTFVLRAQTFVTIFWNCSFK